MAAVTRDIWNKTWKGHSVAVIGFGISNRPLTRLLRQAGADVLVLDGKTLEQLGPSAREMEAAGVRFAPYDADGELPDGIDTLFRTPGVKPGDLLIRRAVAKGVRLTSEMELFLSLTPAYTIGITGSDGKTTTTTLTGLILEQAAARTGARVYVGGNIGTPLLERVFEMTEKDFVVLELSSFQLMTMTQSPRRCAITNISPNHLNWHQSMEEYVRAKCNILLHPDASLFVTNACNPYTSEIAKNTDLPLIYFSAYRRDRQSMVPPFKGEAGALYLRDGIIYYHDGKTEREILRREDLLLPGQHNVENFMTAVGLCMGLAEKEDWEKVAKTFPGVEHRLEFVCNRAGVDYFNSSIDSSPSRTEAALKALNRRPIVLCGGQDKHVPFDSLALALDRQASAVVLTGQARGLIQEALVRAGAKVPVYVESEFDAAVRLAASLAKPGDTVLLSPACTSFDVFSNFEERGRHFKDLVRSLQ
ncbi:MAG: UDP-N-acetylmuramoyl-L-alanine--D-glutamate ligase [Clostridia bacterium]|nr:UDP-N-acetylmuramoyl-L-alanine--D-glutamate ligase [Clostridia bacterium]